MTDHGVRARAAQPLVLLVAGGATGAALRRASDTAVGLGAVLLLLAGILVVRRARRARSRRPGPGPAAADAAPGGRRRRLQVLLWFFYGYYTTFYLGGLGARDGIAAGLVLVAGTTLVVVVNLAVRRRALAAARARHPGATVVLGGLVDLGSMRLMQWSRAAGADLPFTTGEVTLVAGADGLAMERAGGQRAGVHRWAWDEVALSCSHDALLVLTLLGPPPAPRARAVPVARRRFEVTLAPRVPTLAAAVRPLASRAEDAVAGLVARRPVPVRDAAPGDARDAGDHARRPDGVETLPATGQAAGDDEGAGSTMGGPR